MAGEPEFTVHVEGGLDEEGIWVVLTSVTYRDDVSPERRQALAWEIREAILMATRSEYDRARLVGARSIRMEYHELREVFGCTMSPATYSLTARSTADDRDQLLVLEFLYGRRRRG